MKHVLVTIAAAGGLFAMLWFGVVVLNLTPGTSLVASFLTLGIVGLGMTYSSMTRNRSDDRS